MTGLPDAPATSRNREPILELLRDVLRDRRQVLEIGSGTGQHAVYFGRHLPQLVWQTSDLRENHAGISAWIDSLGLPNVRKPLPLDVENDADPPGDYDAVFSANTTHVMHRQAVQAMFELIRRLLPPGAPFCLYGPFRFQGGFTSDSDRRFDASLKAQDPAMGIRDFEWIEELAEGAELRRIDLVAMPANNFFVTWRKTPTPRS